MRSDATWVSAAIAMIAFTGTWCGPARADPLAQPPPAPAATPAAPETLKLKQDQTARMTIDVMVNGQGPYAFLIDTAADRTVISRELATTLKLPSGPAVLMHEATGDDLVETAVIGHLQLGAHGVDHIEAPLLTAANLGAAGMLGVDSLRDLHIVMDFKTLRMSAEPSRPEPVEPDTFVVRGRSRFGQLILVDAALHGERIFVVLDTGSQQSVGNLALQRLLTTADVRQDLHEQTEIIGVTGKRAPAELNIIGELRVGGLLIRHAPMAFAQLPTFNRLGLDREPALLLGMDVLSHFRRVSVDLRRKEAAFTLN